jgi:dolichyl-phosphate beta-glucosyltransferase
MARPPRSLWPSFPALPLPVVEAIPVRSTCIVIPCYNEEARLPQEEFLRFARHHQDLRFLFVNDGSSDGTLEVLGALAARDPDAFEVMSLTRNRGKAEAVRHGVLAANRSGAEFVGYWDADLATPLGEILRFRRCLQRRSWVSMVTGCRIALAGRGVRRSRARHYAGRVVATLATLAVGMPYYDTQCGAKLLRAGDWVEAAFGDPFVTRWVFDVELIARIRRLGRAEGLYELPVLAWKDVPGSKVSAIDGIRAFKDLARIRWHYPG